MKNASWFLAALLGALLYAGWTSLPPAGKSGALTNHVSSRYAERGETETGIHSPLVAVLADYRSFDLWVVSFLFCVSTLGVLSITAGTAKSFPLFPGLFWSGLGTLLALGVALVGPQEGSNLLDFEALALWTDPHRARMDGALFLIAGALLCLAGLLSLFVRRSRVSEAAK